MDMYRCVSYLNLALYYIDITRLGPHSLLHLRENLSDYPVAVPLAIYQTILNLVQWIIVSNVDILQVFIASRYGNAPR